MVTKGRVALYLCLLLSSASLSWAQRSAGLTGTASDNSGAVVSNVKVTVTHQLTGVKWSTVTAIKRGPRDSARRQREAATSRSSRGPSSRSCSRSVGRSPDGEQHP